MNGNGSTHCIGFIMALKIDFKDTRKFDAFGTHFEITFMHMSGKVRRPSFTTGKNVWMKCMKTCVVCSRYPGVEWRVADNIAIYGDVFSFTTDELFKYIDNYARALLTVAKCQSDEGYEALDKAIKEIEAHKNN